MMPGPLSLSCTVSILKEWARYQVPNLVLDSERGGRGEECQGIGCAEVPATLWLYLGILDHALHC